jgi:hypothetical protein
MLAIVIPFYKIDFFEETLSSLATQSNKKFRVYIGNDHSPADPCNLINKFQDKIDIKYTKFNDNLGQKSLVQQWHRCIDLIGHEEWIQILGDDDVIGENFVAEFYAHLDIINSHQINVIRFASAHIDEENRVTSKVFKHPEIESSIDFLFRKFNGGTRSSLSEYIFKRENLIKIQFKDFPLGWFSDLLAVLEISNFKNIYTINTSVVFFRYSKINISGNKSLFKIKNEATINFYFYLLRNDQLDLSKERKQIIFNQIENRALLHKKNIKTIVRIVFYYLKLGKFKGLIKLLLRFIFN